MKALTTICLLYCLFSLHAAGQVSMSNRQKIVNMLLGQSHLKINNSRENHLAGIYVLSSGPQATPSCFRQVSTIPKYCLDKGAVICRLEEYVQLHSPIKLNIGLGGE